MLLITTEIINLGGLQTNLSLDCNGVTREPDAEYQYTLRRGTKLYTSDNGENSWLLAECYVMYEESKTDIIGKLETDINGKFKLSAQHLLRCRVIGFTQSNLSCWLGCNRHGQWMEYKKQDGIVLS